MSEYTLSAVLQLRDRLTPGIRSARQGLETLEQSATGVNEALVAAESSMAGMNTTSRNAVARTNSLRTAMAGAAHSIDGVTASTTRATAEANRLQGSLRGIRSTTATVNLQDRASGGIGRIRTALDSLTGRAHTAVVNVRQQGMFQNMRNGLTGMASGFMTESGAQMAGLAGIGYGLMDTVKTYSSFTAEMSKVAAISGATGTELAALTEKAKEMGATTQFSATESAEALKYMAQAGWKTDEMLAGISGIMSLAAASGEDLGSVSDIVTDALTAFGLKAADAGHFADVLAKAASNSNTNVGLMGYTFKYVAPLAGALKYSIEDVATAVGLMANAGIKGEQAGTSLRSIMNRMIAGTGDAGKAMASLGVSVKNADGSIKPLRQTMQELRTAFAGLTDAQKTEMATSIAGLEALSGFLAIINASDADFAKMIDAMYNAMGAAKEAEKVMNDNLAGDLKSLGSAWESVQISLMEGPASSGLREFVQGVRDDVAKFNEYIQDGLNIEDIGKITMDVLTQLRDKFLELDSVGSVLAGGALAAALYKITKLTKNALDGFRGIFGSAGGGGGNGGGNDGPPTPDHIGNMTVNATNVVVNGRIQQGPGPAPTPGPGGGQGGNGGQGGQGGNGGRGGNGGNGGGRFGRLRGAFRTLGIAGIIAGVANAGMGIYDAYRTNKQTDLEAQWMLDDAVKGGGLAAANNALAYQERNDRYNEERMGSAVGGGVGGLTGMLAGGKAGALAGGAIGALAGPAGTVIGAGIGGLAGGALGAWGGTELGAYLGAQFPELMDSAEEKMGQLSQSMSELGDNLGTSWDAACAGMQTGLNNAGTAVKENMGRLANWIDTEVWPPISNAVIEAKDNISNAFSEAVSSVEGAFDSALQSVKNTWAGASEWFDSNVWQPLASFADNALTFMVGLAGLTWEEIQPYWSSAAEWFEATVLEPVSALFTSAWTSITDTVSTAWTRITDFAGQACEAISDTASAAWNWVTDSADQAWTTITDSAAQAWAWVTDSVSQALVAISDTASAAWNWVADSASQAWNGIVGMYASASEWFAANVWQPVSSAASSAWQMVTEAASAAWMGVTEAWDSAVGWFEATVWTPIRSGADMVRSAIVDAFNGALETVKGAWSDAAEWFSTNVVSPVQSKFNAIMAKGAEIRGITMNNPVGSPEQKASGTSYFTPVKSFASGTTNFEPVPSFAKGTSYFTPVRSFAAGTSYLEHGIAQVNEHGGELMDLPRGTRIYPTGATEDIIRQDLRNGDLLGMSLRDWTMGELPDITTGEASAWMQNRPDNLVGNLREMPLPEWPMNKLGNDDQSIPAMPPVIPTPVSVSGQEPPSRPAAGAVTITVSGNNFTVREEADIDRIAHAIVEQFTLANMNFAGV